MGSNSHITLITVTASYTVVWWGRGVWGQEDANKEGGARLLLSSKDSDSELQLDTACIQRQLICFYQDQGKGNPVEAVKSSFPGTMWFLFTFLLYDKVCSLEPQFGPVTKQKIFSLPHSSRILSSEQL